MVKEYVAMVHGTPGESGDWEDLLFKDSRKNKVFVVKKQRAGVKPARLEFTRLTAGAQSLVRIRLHTGRTHQIRVHMASLGCPIIGDTVYGRHTADRTLNPLPQRQLLHAWKLDIRHPVSGESMCFEAPPPTDLTEYALPAHFTMLL